MPPRIRFIGRYGNGMLVFAFGLMAIFTGDEGMALVLFFLAVAALGVFNIYVVEKSAKALSGSALNEEEWLQAELRKAQLRRQIAEAREGEPPQG